MLGKFLLPVGLALEVVCLFFPSPLSAQCPQIEAIMIDACGTEQLNEFVIIHSGGGFNTADIQLDFDSNNNFAGPQNNDININANPCGLIAGNTMAYTGCPNLISVGPGVNIPPNAIVVLQTSAGATPNTYNFSSLCGGGQCVFVISSSCVRTGGAFTNGGGNGTRTTHFYIAGGCQQTITYDLQQVPVGNGTYMLPVSGTFGNDGCVAPPAPAPPFPPNINPIPNVTACGSYTLPPITGTNLTPNAAYYTGTNGTGTQYNPGDVITSTTTLYAFDSNGPGCSDQEQFTVTIIAPPTVNQPNNSVACAGQQVTVNFSGSPGASFQWTNSNPAIGLPASGTGNISFTAANVNSPEVGTITVTPVQGNCQGTPVSFTITVNPSPTVDNPGNQTACAGQQVTVNFSSPAGNPTFNWTNSNPAIGLPASGTGNISFTAANPANPISGTISVSATLNGCTGPAQTFTITINPAATVNAPANQTACAGQQVTVNFSGSPGASFQWTNSNPAIGLPASGTGNISFTAANVNSPEVGTVTVTPTSPQGCTGNPVSFTITVNPGPEMNNPGDQTACAGQQVTVNFSGPAGNPTFNWTNSNPAIGLPASGTGNISFTAANPANPISGTISVSATLNGCTGPAQTFTITVNPAATVNAPANQTACAGQQVTVNFTGSPGASFQWTNSNPAIGLPANGSGDLNFTAANVNTPQTGTITVTPTSPQGCTGSAVSFTITVNPLPTVNAPANQTACAGQQVTVNFSGSPGASFQWTNSNPAIGLPASGTGNISFTAANVNSPEVGTITVTPVQGNCQGTPVSFTITVNPSPTVDNPGNQTACAGQQVTVNFSSPAGNPTFNWTNSNPAIGLPASGTGNISFTAANPANPISGTISVSATLNGCTGPAQTFTITINPAATVNAPANQTACAGQQVTVNFSGSPGASFQWTNSNPAIGLPASGTGNISFTAANVNSPEVGTVTVTPTSPQGCTGNPVSFTITVNPGPEMNNPGDQTACAGQQVTVNFSSPAGNPTFNWTNSNPAIGLPASGTGNISFTAANPANPISGTISVSATLNGCTGPAQTFTITVNPAATVNAPANQTACAGQQVTVNFTGSPGASFQWTNSNPAIGLPANGSGDLNFTAANVNTPQTGTITVTPTSPQGCTGSAVSFTITVNSLPTVNAPANQTACAGQQVTVNFSGSPGASFQWTNSNPAIGLPASGTGNISFTAANVNSPEVGTITVTPVQGNCQGTPVSFTITVNPSPTVDNPGNQTACAGQQVTVNFSSPAGNPTFNWTNSNPAIGLPASGTGNISFTAANPANPISGTISVSATLNGCTGPAQTFTITINPAATVNAPANQTACAGQQVTVNFSGSPGASFQWTNSNPAIGLPASGTGNISFTAANVNSPEVGTVTVTPTSPQGCTGNPVSFTITVNPNPTMDPPVNQSVCGGDAVNVVFSSPGGNPTFNWTNSNPAIGLPAGGTGNISFTAANPAGTQTATIAVTPVLNGCAGATQTFTITVTPRPTVNPVPNQTICGNQNVSIAFSGTAGAVFEWTNSNPAIGLPASGTGNISFTAANPSAPETAVITVTPQLGNCSGNPLSFTLTLNPSPAVDPVADVFACAGEFVAVTFSSPLGNPTYTWTNSNPAIGLGAAGVGNIGFTTANTGSTQTGTVLVTPQLNGCVGTPATFNISVSPAPTMGQPANASACGGSTVNIAFAGTPGAVFEWTNNNPNVGLAPSGSGNISFVSANPEAVEVATIVVQPVLNGCAGPARTFTITIRPTPEVIFPGDRAVCGGDPVSVTFSSPSGNPTYTWLNNNPAIGLGASGTGNINFTSAIVGSPQVGTVVVTPSQNGCTGPSVSFDIIVSPAPTANPLPDVQVCSREERSIALSGSLGASFSWTNNNTATGLAASGSGDTITFTAAHVSAPQVSTIVVTPRVGTCTGPSVVFDLTVLPLPTVDSVESLTACSGESVTVSFTGSPGATFHWTNDNTAIGLPAQGVGNLNFVAASVVTAQSAQIRVTPELNGCLGEVREFALTVVPAASLPLLQDRTLCAGDSLSIGVTSPGVSVSWANSNPAIGLAATGAGDIQFTAAPVSAPQQALITLTATANSGNCPSVSRSFSVNVKPVLDVENPGDRTACSGETVEVVFSNSLVRWTNDNPAIGLPSSGVGDLSFAAPNVPAVEVANLTVTPLAVANRAYIPNWNGYISVVDLSTNAVVAQIPVGAPAYGVAVDARGSRVYVTTDTSSNNGALMVLDAVSQTVVGTVPLAKPRGVAVSANGQEVYVTHGETFFSIVDAQSLTLKSTLPMPVSTNYGIALAPDGKTAYVGAAQELSSVDLPTQTSSALSTPTPALVRGVDLEPTGRLLYGVYDGATGQDSLWITDVLTNSSVGFIPVGSAPTGVVFNPANGLVYVANANSASVSVCDPVTRSVVATIPVGNGPIGVDATPDGKRVYVACLSGQVYEIDAIGQVVTSIVDVGGSATAFGRFLVPAQACIGSPQTFKITISARPTLQPISDITVCSEQAVNVLFNSSPGATVQWTNTNPAIGLPENGTGNLQFMSASVVVPQTAVISATPALAGCTGAPVSFVLTVVPGADTLLIDNSTCDPNLAGTFVQNLTNRFGCDSVVITTTLLLPSDTTILNQTTCNPNAAGTFVQTLTNQAGCDSLVVTIVAFDPNAADTTLITTTTCDPNAAGTFVQTLTNHAGCDSVVVTTTLLLPSDTTILNQTTCNPNAAGTFVQTLTNQAGCDSVVVTIVAFDPNAADTTLITTTTCDLNTAGTFVQTLTNQAGCDSVVITTTLLLPSDTTVLNQTTCNPNAAGTFVQTLTNQAGCDSVVITIVAFDPNAADTTLITTTTCDLNAAGTFVQTLTNQAGCDSVVITTTLLLPSDTTVLNQTTCNPNAAGTFVQTLTNQAGCDSVVVTIVAFDPNAADTTLITTTTCDPNTAGTFVQTLANQAGCDSVVVTIVAFDPNAADTTLITTTTCDPNTAGTFVQTLANQAGCDSVVVTIVAFDPNAADTTLITTTTCDPNTAGTFVQTLANQAGCDSVVIINTVYDPNGCAPIALVSGRDPLCADRADGSFTLQAQSGLLPLTYTWSGPAGGSGSGQITALQTPATVSDLPAGSYAITFTDPNGLSTTLSVVLTAPPALEATAVATSSFGGFSVRCSNSAEGAAKVLVLGGTSPYTYRWSSGGSAEEESGLSAGTYTVEVRDANGCSATANVTLSAPEPLVFSLNVGRGDCGDTLVDISVQVKGGVSPYLLTLDGNAVSGPVPGLTAGTHTVGVRDANGCTADSTVTVALPPIPVISLPADTAVVMGTALRIEATTNITTWRQLVWTPLPDSSCPNCLVQSWTPQRTQRLSVKITDENGCSATAHTLVRVLRQIELYVPNAFRPQGTPENNLWRLSAGRSVVELREVAVFDRWGDLLYRWTTSIPPNEWPGWDGTTRGHRAQPGVYVYYLKVLLADNTEEVLKGDLTILD